MTNPDLEQRLHPRAPIELKVEYKKMNSFFADYTKNISKGGTFIKTNRPLPKGTMFLFKLFLPRRDQPFTLNGEVIWTNDSKQHDKPDVEELGMGIRFIFVTTEERGHFEREVEALMVEQLGSPLYHKLMEKAHDAD